MRGIHHGDMREATIDLDAITANVRHLRALTGVPVIAVVKADGYGHGAPRVAAAALSLAPCPFEAPTRYRRNTDVIPTSRPGR